MSAATAGTGRLLVPNTTQTPNVIFDFWMADLTGAELKVLLYVARHTYGWHKETDRLSIHQICEGIKRKDGTTLDRGAGISPRQAHTAIRTLVAAGVLDREMIPRDDGGSQPPLYALNLDCPPEGFAERLEQARKGEDAMQKLQTPPSNNCHPPPSNNCHPPPSNNCHPQNPCPKTHVPKPILTESDSQSVQTLEDMAARSGGCRRNTGCLTDLIEEEEREPNEWDAVGEALAALGMTDLQQAELRDAAIGHGHGPAYVEAWLAKAQRPGVRNPGGLVWQRVMAGAAITIPKEALSEEEEEKSESVDVATTRSYLADLGQGRRPTDAEMAAQLAILKGKVSTWGDDYAKRLEKLMAPK